MFNIRLTFFNCQNGLKNGPVRSSTVKTVQIRSQIGGSMSFVMAHLNFDVTSHSHTTNTSNHNIIYTSTPPTIPTSMLHLCQQYQRYVTTHANTTNATSTPTIPTLRHHPCQHYQRYTYTTSCQHVTIIIQHTNATSMPTIPTLRHHPCQHYQRHTTPCQHDTNRIPLLNKAV